MVILLLLFGALFIYVSLNKKSIIKKVTEEIGKKINGNVSVGDVEISFWSTFPKASVLLRNVSVTDTMFASHRHPFFTGEKVYVELGIISLLKNKSAINGFKIQKASVYLYTAADGYTNAYLLRPKNDSSSSASVKGKSENELRSIVFKDVRITIDDRKSDKLHDIDVKNLDLSLSDNAVSTLFSVKTNLIIHSLAFYIPNGSFVKEKEFGGDFNFKYDKQSKQLQFDSIRFRLSGQPFNFSGIFDLEGPYPQFQARIHTRNISYDFAKTLLTTKIAKALSIVETDKKLDADASLSGPLRGGDPVLNVHWKIYDAHITTSFLKFDHASFSGYYTNEASPGVAGKDADSKIINNNFSASWQGFTVTSANIEIVNLNDPVLTCDLHSNFPLTQLNEITGSNSIQFYSGEGSVNVTYKGPLEKNNNSNSQLNGVIAIKRGDLMYVPRNVELKNTDGQLVFKNSDLFIENLECDISGNKLIMNGHAKNLVTLLSTEPAKAQIDWNIYTPSLNLNPFTYLLQPREKTKGNETNQYKANKVASGIDAVLENGSLNVNLKAASLQYRKFEANDLAANISLLQNNYTVNSLTMKHAGGTINLTGSLVINKENYDNVNVNATFQNVDVNKVFEAFNNFGQNGITSQNLEGKLDATISAALIINDEGKAYPNSLSGVVDFSLKNGGLIHFEPLEKLQPFLFTSRDLDNIRFAELKDHLEISNQEVKINRMEIESNVLSMYVEGVYSMKGNTDISLQIPLSNLNKRDSEYKPENLGLDRNAGPSVFLRGQPGSDGKIRFKPDIFKKFKRGKKINN